MNPKSSSLTLSSIVATSTPPASPDQRLAFRVRRRGDTVVLSVRGQADAFTLALWRQQVREAAGTAATAGGGLIVDTSRLDFLSLRTLGALIEDADRFVAKGVRTCLVTSDLRLARLAAEFHAGHLMVRSTVVSAHTALDISPRPLAPVGRRQPCRPPQVTREEPAVDRWIGLENARHP